MRSEPETASVILLETVRDTLSGHAVWLISDHPPCPPPEWITATLSSTETLATSPTASRHACGLILTPWVDPGKQDAVIAHLRDFLSLELYALHPGNAVEQARRMGALGLRCLDVFEVDGQPWGLNHFSLKTYKKTPGWLNSRFWANPRLWNKFRW